jgi:hypothetical protein
MDVTAINWPRLILRIGLVLVGLVVLLLLSVFVVGGDAGAIAGNLSAELVMPALGFVLLGGGLSTRKAWLRWLLIVPGTLLLMMTVASLATRVFPAT